MARKSYTIPLLLNTPAFLEAWDLYLEHRKEKRKPLTPAAANLRLLELEQMGVDRAIRAIRHSIKNNWLGIFEPESGEGKYSGTPVRGDDGNVIF